MMLSYRRLARVFLLGLLLCSLFSLPAAAAGFSTADRVLLAEYRALGREQAPMLIATAPERTAAVATALAKLGAQVVGRRDVIGYLYAMVPLDSLQSVLAIKGLEAVQLAANPVRARMDPEPSSSPAASVRDPSALGPTAAGPRFRGAPPSAALAADNPYTDESATQALGFKARHPTYDGRGVVTAFVENAPPEMATMRGALDLHGRALPKFAQYRLMAPVAAFEAVTDAKQFVWQKTERVEPDAHGAFSWRGRDYRLPADFPASEIGSTEWRICRRLSGFIPDEHDVLWAVNRERVWALPASKGGDFGKARSVSVDKGFAWVTLEDRDIATAAPDLQKQPLIAGSLVFSVDRRRGWLALLPTLAFHAGMVGSVMAGSGFMGSQANGVAPAAQISIFQAPYTQGAQTLNGHEQMLEMLSDPHVDVAQASITVGDTSRFGTAAVQSIWTDRLIAANGKPFVKAAGNHGPRLYGISELAMAESVFSVGAYVSRPSWRVNYGIEPAGEHVLASYSGWGPAHDGGLKPDFLSLTHTLSEGGREPWYWEGKTGNYGISGGTSAAAPHGAGHVALLVSAAKQVGIAHDAARLRAAIATTAQFFDDVEARAQGHGLIQVSDAWEALQRARDWTPPSFKVQAPLVAQEAGPHGPQRFTGRGLFELAGWKPGQTGRRELIVTRTAGKRGASRFALRWKGHTQVFRSELREIELPLGKPVSIPVDIRVGSSGSYSAILDLVDPRVELIAGSILNTVMVADTLVPNSDGLRYERESPRPGSSLFYIDVPTGLSALTVDLRKDGGTSILVATDPTGRQLPFTPYGSEVYRPDAASMARRELHRTFPDPVPGTWQLAVINTEPNSMLQLEAVKDWSRPMPLTLHVQGWTDMKEAVPANASASRPIELRMRSTPGGDDAELEAIGIGAARESQAVLRPGLEPTFFDVQVAPGSTNLDILIDHADPAARIGLYVFKVPEGERVESTLNSDDTMLVYHDSSFQQRKHYSLDAPPPGRYRVAIDPIDLSAGQLAVRYRDVVHHPLYGTVSLAAGGTTTSGTATVTVRARPADGSRLYAEVGLFKPLGADTRAVLAREGWFVEP